MARIFKLMNCLSLVFLSIWANGQSNQWKPEDIVNQERVSSFDFSPDGNNLVWVKTRPSPKKDKFVSDIWLTRNINGIEEDARRQIQLTYGDESDRNVIFSRDGKSIYFLSTREGGKKLWKMNLDGGEAFALDSFKVSISNLEWLNDSCLLYKAEEGKTLYEIENKKDNTVVVEDKEHFKTNRLFSYSIKSKKSTRLTNNQFPISEFDVSKDGKWIVSRHTLSPHYGADGKPSPTYYLWNLEEGTSQQILNSAYQTPGGFEFAWDNKGFYFRSTLSSNPEWQGAGISILHYFDISTMSSQEVPLEWAWGLSGGPVAMANGVWINLAKGAENEWFFYEKKEDEWLKRPLNAEDREGRINILKVDAKANYVAYRYSTASQPTSYEFTALFRYKTSFELADRYTIASVNKHLEKLPKTKSEIIKWRGAMNDEITGILYYPLEYQEGRSYPLVLSIHGGPAGVDTDRWQDRYSTYPHLLAQKGAFVLKPNYHGSSNHGQKFVESIKKHYYEYEIPDVLSGIDKLVSEGKVHEDSLAVMGWSNGAIIATMLTVQYPDKFKLCAAGAGDVNWTSDYGTCRFGVTFDQSYFGGAPWDNVNGKNYNEAYIEKSPLFEMEKVQTPTIIFHGSEDRAVPRDQGWEYYRALQQIGKAPVRFLWFPGQRHGLAKLTHQLRKIKEELAWFDRYLWGTYKAPNESIKKSSPLMALVEVQKSHSVRGRWGKEVKGVLIPQVVAIKKDSISIGRFEITNAQYKAFSKEYSYPAGRDNYPVVGLGYEQAKQYADWLSNRTGEKYRLPLKAEVEAWKKKIEKVARKENTLTYWAGYEITKEDIPGLIRKIEEEKLDLIMEAGRFEPVKVGDAVLYDLGGNVSEWFENGGKSGIYGFSAYDFADQKSNDSKPNQNYTGFRIVKE